MADQQALAPPRPLAAAGSPPFGRQRPKLADGLALLGLTAVFITAAAVALGLAAYLHHGRRADPGNILYRVGTTALDVPGQWLRPGVSRTGGPLERLELVIPWPGEDASLASGGLTTRSAIDGVVLVSLGPADTALTPSERPARLYARFLTAEVWPNPGGLILRRFRPGTPYEDEELYLSPPDGHVFAARCPRGGAAASVREGCVAELRVGGLDAQLRFAPARLVAWERLVEGVRRAIVEMSTASP